MFSQVLKNMEHLKIPDMCVVFVGFFFSVLCFCSAFYEVAWHGHVSLLGVYKGYTFPVLLVHSLQINACEVSRVVFCIRS
jgi:hypothetical protein